MVARQGNPTMGQDPVRNSKIINAFPTLLLILKFDKGLNRET
jgi:hypothetical protein